MPKIVPPSVCRSLGIRVSKTPSSVKNRFSALIQRSPRHKSGVAVRFPRMLRWRTDKRPEDADSLETIVSMLEAEGR